MELDTVALISRLRDEAPEGSLIVVRYIDIHDMHNQNETEGIKKLKELAGMGGNTIKTFIQHIAGKMKCQAEYRHK